MVDTNMFPIGARVRTLEDSEFADGNNDIISVPAGAVGTVVPNGENHAALTLQDIMNGVVTVDFDEYGRGLWWSPSELEIVTPTDVQPEAAPAGDDAAQPTLTTWETLLAPDPREALAELVAVGESSRAVVVSNYLDTLERENATLRTQLAEANARVYKAEDDARYQRLRTEQSEKHHNEIFDFYKAHLQELGEALGLEGQFTQHFGLATLYNAAIALQARAEKAEAEFSARVFWTDEHIEQFMEVVRNKLPDGAQVVVSHGYDELEGKVGTVLGAIHFIEQAAAKVSVDFGDGTEYVPSNLLRLVTSADSEHNSAQEAK